MNSPSSKVILSKQPCPNCPSSDAYHVYEDGHGYCFSCKYYSSPQNKGSPSTKENNFTYQALSWRAINASTFNYFNALTKVGADGNPISVGFRYPTGAYQVRLRDSKTFFWINKELHKPGCFGTDKFAAGSHKHVIITEGALDALSYYQVLRGCPCISVQSSGSAVSDCTADWDYINSFERIYLALDGDAKGRDAVSAVARLFNPDKVFHIRFTNRKDANEYLAASEDIELLNLYKNAKRYLPDNLSSELEEFKKALLSTTNKGFPYPFLCLNEKTYGIRMGECVLLLAQEKVGKTELMHLIEHKLLTEAEGNVGAIFLEEPKQRHLQALAGIELKRPCHLPDSGCTPDQIVEALGKVVQKDDHLFLYSHFGTSDPDILLETIRLLVTGYNCRYILFDHITMGVVGNSEMDGDERRILDYLITKLEMLVKELNFALIVVSHVNDFGQSRGSHYLTKVADITIRIERDLMSTDPIAQNTWHLSIPYNRFCGKTGVAGNVIYDPSTCTFTEAANDNQERFTMAA